MLTFFLAYHATPHASTGKSSYLMMFGGRKMTGKIQTLVQPTDDDNGHDGRDGDDHYYNHDEDDEDDDHDDDGDDDDDDDDENSKKSEAKMKKYADKRAYARKSAIVGGVKVLLSQD